jgi:hypothetical protein
MKTVILKPSQNENIRFLYHNIFANLIFSPTQFFYHLVYLKEIVAYGLWIDNELETITSKLQSY